MASTNSKMCIFFALFGVLLTVDLAVSQANMPGDPVITNFVPKPTLNTVMTLTCTSAAASSSVPQITIQWLLNDNFLGGDVQSTANLVTTSTIAIPITARDMVNDEIKCEAVNSVGRTETSVIIVDVQQKPTVTAITPAAAFFDTGTMGTWTLNISDAYPGLILSTTPRWYIDDTQTFQFSTSTSVDAVAKTYSYTSTLTRSLNPSDHNLIIKCEIDHPTFDSGIETRFRSMIVRYPPGHPQITTNFINGVNENTILEGNCSSRGGYPTPIVAWSGTAFDVTSSYTSGSDLYVTQFRLTAVVGLIGQTFTCTTQNAVGTYSATATLPQVFVPPGAIVIEGFQNVIIEGHVMSLKCTSQGALPSASVMWNLPDGSIDTSYSTEQNQSWTRAVNTHNYTARFEDNGKRFNCSATNRVNSVSQTTQQFTVHVQPAVPSLAGPSEVYEGTAVNFTCKATRTNPAASLFWLISTTPMAASYPVTSSTNGDGTTRTSSTINIVPTAQLNATVLTCEAAHVTLPSNLKTSITIIVRLKPSIVLASPSSENVLIASVHSIDCDVTSSIEFNITWWHVSLSGVTQMLTAVNSKYIMWTKTSTIRTLSIQNYQSSDDGSYYAIAANQAGLSPPSAIARTTGYAIPVKPFINLDTFNFYPVVGANVVMNCSSTGGVPITMIKWYRNNVAVDTTSITSNVNGVDVTYNEYTRSVVFDDKGAIFKCEASNAFGNTSSVTSFVDVYVRVEVDGGISGDSNVIAGKNTTLTCTTTPSYPQPTVEWWMAAERLLGNKLTPGTSDSNGAIIVRSDVYFVPDQADTGKTVSCIVKQDMLPHNASASLLITVHGPPSANAHPNKNVTLNEHVTFTCSVTSTLPTYNVTWYKRTSNTEGTRITSVNEKYAVDDNHPVYKLWVYSVVVSDNGIYYCIAQSAAGNSSRAEVSLTVYTAPSKPSFYGGLTSLTIAENSNIEATCVTTVHPANTASFTWYYVGTTGETEVDDSFVNANVLNIPSADRTKAGTYVCQTFNSFGSSRANFTVDIKYPPRLNVGNVQTDFSATAEDLVKLSCNVIANPPPTAYLWTHENNNVATTKDLEVKVKAGEHTYTCVATNEMGPSQGIIYTVVAPQVTLPDTGASTADVEGLSGGVIAAIVLGVIFIIIILIICCVGCKYYKDKTKDDKVMRTTKKSKTKHKPSSVVPDTDDRRSTLYPSKEKDPAYLFGPTRPSYRAEQRHYPREISAHDYHHDYSQRGGYDNTFYIPAPGSEMDDMSVFRETGFRSRRQRLPHALPPLATASYTREAKRRKNQRKKNQKKRQQKRQAGEGMENPAKSKDTSPQIVIDDSQPEKDAAQDTNILLGDQFK